MTWTRLVDTLGHVKVANSFRNGDKGAVAIELGDRRRA